jgi:hypothetical protein
VDTDARCFTPCAPKVQDLDGIQMCAGPRVGLSALARGVILAALSALHVPEVRAQTASAPEPARIKVEVRGALALIELDRPLQFGREYGLKASDEVVLDLALPPGARLLRAEVRGAGAPLRLTSNEKAAATYADYVRLAELRRAKVPVDEGADLRLSVAGPGFGEGDRAGKLRLWARFVAPLACQAGDLALSFPAALEPDPRPAEVSLTVVLGEGAPPLARVDLGDSVFRAVQLATGARVTATVPTRAPWQIILAPRHPRPAGYTVAAVTPGPSRLALTTLCRPPTPVAPPSKVDSPPPSQVDSGRPLPSKVEVRSGIERVLFLVDRSRSMGGPGVGSGAALARALALGLPPGTRFGAVFFDREATAFAPVFRATTLEALAAFESAAGGGALRNGTRLLPALRLGRDLLKRDDPTNRARTLVVLVTDGALPEDHGPAAFGELLNDRAFAHARFASVILREPHEERPAGFALRTFARLAAHGGGLVREMPPVGAAEAAPAILAALATGGDLIDVRPTAGMAPTQASDGRFVPPGEGTRFLGPASGGSINLGGTLGGARVSFRAVPVAVDAEWKGGMASGGVAPQLALPTPAAGAVPVAALLAAPVLPIEDRLTRGGLDKDVVHRALTYAYLPRARACYVTRAIRSAADFQLRGRVRLEMRIERGEMMEAAVARSSLGRPDIEACLREAAFTVEIPRPVLNDAPAVAALNLVLRPRTEASAPAAPTELDRAVDAILGPRGKPIDPLELLIEDEPRDALRGAVAPARATSPDAWP